MHIGQGDDVFKDPRLVGVNTGMSSRSQSGVGIEKKNEKAITLQSESRVRVRS